MPLLNSELPGIGSGTFFRDLGNGMSSLSNLSNGPAGLFFDKLKENQPPRALDRFDKA